MNAASTYPTNESAATVIAYGSWVEMWLIWFDIAPADDMIVVSEIGEQWSPHTAPARQAAMPMMSSSLVGSNIAVTIGISIINLRY